MRARGATGQLPWAEVVPQWNLPAGQHVAVWLRTGRPVEADLVVCEQAVRHLSTWLLLARRRRPPVALWGHGHDHARDRGPTGRFRDAMLRAPDWWFAYTAEVARYVVAQGFPASRVTEVRNALRPATVTGAAASSRSGWKVAYLGAIDLEVKRLSLLVEAVDALHARGVHVTIAGEGKDRAELIRRFAGHQGVSLPGRLVDSDKASLFASVDLIVHPGPIGLLAVDALHAGKVVITTRGHQMPEFAYLREAGAAIVAEATPESLATTVVRVLEQPADRTRREASALRHSRMVTLEEMVRRFRQGCHDAMSAGRRRG